MVSDKIWSIRTKHFHLEQNAKRNTSFQGISKACSGGTMSPQRRCNVLGNSSDSLRKQIFRDNYHENVRCVYSFESHHRGDSNECIQHTIV